MGHFHRKNMGKWMAYDILLLILRLFKMVLHGNNISHWDNHMILTINNDALNEWCEDGSCKTKGISVGIKPWGSEYVWVMPVWNPSCTSAYYLQVLKQQRRRRRRRRRRRQRQQQQQQQEIHTTYKVLPRSSKSIYNPCYKIYIIDLCKPR